MIGKGTKKTVRLSTLDDLDRDCKIWSQSSRIPRQGLTHIMMNFEELSDSEFIAMSEYRLTRDCSP